MLVLLCICVATEFSANKDLYNPDFLPLIHNIASLASQKRTYSKRRTMFDDVSDCALWHEAG